MGSVCKQIQVPCGKQDTHLNIKVLDGFTRSLVREIAQVHSFSISLRLQTLKYSSSFLNMVWIKSNTPRTYKSNEITSLSH